MGLQSPTATKATPRPHQHHCALTDGDPVPKCHQGHPTSPLPAHCALRYGASDPKVPPKPPHMVTVTSPCLNGQDFGPQSATKYTPHPPPPPLCLNRGASAPKCHQNSPTYSPPHPAAPWQVGIPTPKRHQSHPVSPLPISPLCLTEGASDPKVPPEPPRISSTRRWGSRNPTATPCAHLAAPQGMGLMPVGLGAALPSWPPQRPADPKGPSAKPRPHAI